MTCAAAARLTGAGVTAFAAAALLLTACGGPRRPSLTAQVATADALVAEGCYRCLDEAVARYFALPPARGAAAAANETKLFRALILLALREKELDLDAAPHLKQAGHLVARTSDPATAREQLRWAELVPSTAAGLPRDAVQAERARLASATPDLERRLAGAATATDPIDAYLNLALTCAQASPLPRVEPDRLAAPAVSHPVVQWRLATCGRGQDDALRAFAAAHPRYVEADYWLGRNRIARAGGDRTILVGLPADRREARARLQAALTAIPHSPAIAFDLAGVLRVTNPQEALPLYERVTRAQPRHHEAWLGQGICLTYLDRPREAIAALSRVVDLGEWLTGDALYWRAWNHHTLGDLETAWGDVEQARRLLYNTDVYGLAGRIAFERKALDTAQPLLEKARELSEANCAATWFLGLVHSTQERWLPGGEVFEGAERCYRGEIARIRAELALGDGDDADEAARADRQAKADASIRSAEQQAALAAYNAAFNFVKGGDRDRARPLLDRAVTHPEVAERARELRAFVDR